MKISNTVPQNPEGWQFDNSYARLPEAFFNRIRPVPLKDPGLVVFNEALASELGLDARALREGGAGLFAGNAIPEGADPIAQAYVGHQFGYFTNLCDGRFSFLHPAGEGW